MSLFTQTSSALAAAAAQWADLQEEINDQVESLTDLTTQQSSGAQVALEVLEGLLEASSSVAARLAPLRAALAPTLVQAAKFKAKADEGERNPDAQIYGSGMLLKIRELAAQAVTLQAELEPAAAAFTTLHLQLEQSVREVRTQEARQAQAAAVAAAESEAAAAVARAEAERVAAKQAKTQAEQTAIVEAQVAQANQFAAEEVARVTREAAETRAAEERTQRETAAAAQRVADAAAVTAAQAAASEEQSRKPLLERSIDALKLALAELKSSCTAEEHLVALQTLLKFLSNIMTSPRDEKFRHIRSANDIFQRRLGVRPGGLKALTSIGFELITTPAVLPAGSELQPSVEYYKIDAKAELWPVLVESKKLLEEAMRTSGGAPAPAAAPATAAAPPAAAGFSGFPFFPPAAAAAGGAPPAAAASPFGAGFNPLALMSDPFVMQLMSSPGVMQSMMSGAPLNQGALMSALMSNPQMMTSAMQSPLVQQMLADPSRMHQMQQFMAGGMPTMGMGMPAMFGAGQSQPQQPASPAAAPAANPLASFMQQMMAMRPPAAAPAAPASVAAPAVAPVVAPIAAPVAAPAVGVAPPSGGAPMDVSAEDAEAEEAMLAEAIAMSMQQQQQQPPPQ